VTSDSKNIFNETWSAILMSLTALLTAWSAYQSNLWNGNQAYELTQGIESHTTLTQEVLGTAQHKMMDGIISLQVVEALVRGDQVLVDFLLPRLREDLREPISNWLALDPMHNKDAPAHPLRMPEYLEKVVKKSEDHQAKIHAASSQHMRDAQRTGDIADNYVLLTVLFSAVLFFAGIASSFKNRHLQTVLVAIATAVMLISLWKLCTLDVAWS
jgi:hypothetical protein